MKHLRRGDRIVVIAGDDRGKQGTILSCKGDRATVSGIALVKKHRKSQKPQLTESSIHISNISLCDEQGVKVKTRCRFVDGVKQLYLVKENGETLHRRIGKKR